MRFVFAAALAFAAPAYADPCKRFVFDPPGTRHSLPQMVAVPNGLAIVGYDSPQFGLHYTVVDPAKRTTKSVSLGAGFMGMLATNGREIGLGFIDVVKPGPQDEEIQFTVIDGRRVHTPRSNRNQSYFTVLDPNGKTIVKRIPLGDQRVMHTSPGVAVAWNPDRREWAAIWSEFNLLKFARIEPGGRVFDERKIVVDGFHNASSKLVWTGKSYAMVAVASSGFFVFEIREKEIRSISIPYTGSVLEPVIAAANGDYAVVYRSMIEERHELQFVRIRDGVAHAPRTITKTITNTPVIAFDGKGFAIAWGQPAGKRGGFDDRLFVARVATDGQVTKKPMRVDSEDVHQGYATFASTSCGVSLAYILGDPNGVVRLAVRGVP